MTHSFSINAADGSGSFRAYIALPESGHGPAVIALQEIFGVNAGMRGICDTLAAEGYVAVCPDLFWRQEPGIDLTDKSQQEWDKALALFDGFNFPVGVDDIAATIAAVRALKACSGKVGVVGYCLGGLLAYLTAARTDADACVSYYGVGINQKTADADGIKNPLMMHIAEEDSFVSKTQQAEIHAALDNNPLITIHDYAGVNHAFARPNGNDWDEAAAISANERTAEFFEKHLKAL